VPEEDPFDEPTAPLPVPDSADDPTDALPVQRKLGGRVLLGVLIGVLVLVLCGGGAAALYLVGTKDRQPAAAAASAPPPTPRAHPSSATPSPAFDPGSIIRGNCVTNTGNDEAPVLHLVACGPGTYLVLVRIDSTSDVTKCRTVPGVTHHYFYSTTPATLDFVLCLRKQ
jgi:hypothetical protein